MFASQGTQVAKLHVPLKNKEFWGFCLVALVIPLIIILFTYNNLSIINLIYTYKYLYRVHVHLIITCCIHDN